MLKTELSKKFIKEFEKILRNFPDSEERVFREIDTLSPNNGNKYSGFKGKGLSIKKIRIDLKEYHISKPDALRVICLFNDKGKRVPLVIYHKKHYEGEGKIKKKIKKRVDEYLAQEKCEQKTFEKEKVFDKDYRREMFERMDKQRSQYRDRGLER